MYELKKIKTNFPLINEGLSFLFGSSNDLLVKNSNNDIICSFYNSEDGEILIKKYLQDNNIDFSTCKYIEFKKPSSDELKLLDEYRLTFLDGQLMLYKKVLEISKTSNIEFSNNSKKAIHKIRNFYTVD
ncbi:MAG: hypothetical protein ACRC57_14105 [Sarcina sp.]